MIVSYGFLINVKLIELMCQNVGTTKRNLFQTNRVFVPKIVLCVIQENCFCIEKLNKIFTLSIIILPKK